MSLLSQDVNDNVPFFTSSIYEASVTEGAQIGTSVLQVSAHDKDLGLNGEVRGNLSVFMLYRNDINTCHSRRSIL